MKHLKNLNKTTSPNTTINEGFDKNQWPQQNEPRKLFKCVRLTLPISYDCHSVLEADSDFQVPPDRSNS